MPTGPTCSYSPEIEFLVLHIYAELNVENWSCELYTLKYSKQDSNLTEMRYIILVSIDLYLDPVLLP
jgi:hypothetical protein